MSRPRTAAWRPRLALALLHGGAAPVLVAGHGSLVSPLPRNAIDRSLPKSQRTPEHPCSCTNTTDDECDIGQSCYWYSQGCFIGCPVCDSVSGRRQADICGLGFNATLPPEYRTVNLDSFPGSAFDIYRHNPWRAPGSAPVMDACGLAGGTPWSANVSEWGDYVNTRFASHGDAGSATLRPMNTPTAWRRGATAEVAWQVTANHGGGYAYRLCPVEERLTEACFQSPSAQLEFVPGQQALRFANGTRLPIGGRYVSTGTHPAGSMWARNPLPPRCLGNGCKTDHPCVPCPGTPGSDCTTCDNTPEPSFPPPCDEGDMPGLCSGNQGGPVNVTAAHFYTGVSPAVVVDVLRVPATLRPGRYVLGWRLDCEATAQVWSSCVSAVPTPLAPQTNSQVAALWRAVPVSLSLAVPSYLYLIPEECKCVRLSLLRQADVVIS